MAMAMRWSQNNPCNPVWVIVEILVSYFDKYEVNITKHESNIALFDSNNILP